MNRIRRVLDSLSIAASNLLHALLTPREVLSDEIAIRALCVKLRALGLDPEEALSALERIALAGAISDRESMVVAKIIGQRAILLEDMLMLYDSGYSIAPWPAVQRTRRSPQMGKNS